LTYRYTGDAPALLKEVVEATRLPVVSAGSIDSCDRIDEVRDTGAWGYTIGTAFFKKKFVPEGSFRDNMMAAWDWVQEHGRPD
jgi:phosphoribosylformimino-5-aminoimidazole carboxamide ribonucleotide (ProFAR) isomerase